MALVKLTALVGGCWCWAEEEEEEEEEGDRPTDAAHSSNLLSGGGM
jgi:hypothetical protein